jgi:hypothetical protein
VANQAKTGTRLVVIRAQVAVERFLALSSRQELVDVAER